MVPKSTYSSSLPTGTPRARRVTCMPRRLSASAMAWAVASPSAVKLVARITSCTTPSPARSSSFCTPMSRGPTPSSGDSRPMSTKYRPRKAAVRSMAAWSAGVSTTHRRLASRVASMQVAQTSPSVKV